MSHHTFRFELAPNRSQRVKLAKSVGARRFVYNWGLAESQRTYEATGKRPRLSELKGRLVQLKKSECPWLYEVSAHIGQQALADLDRAFEQFFERLKTQSPRSGFPRFKRKGERDSCRVYKVELHERHLRLPMIGWVRLKETATERGFEGRILSATITRRADRWFVSLVVERDGAVVPPRPIVRATDIVGVDIGLRSAAVIHDGFRSRTIEPRRALRGNLTKLRRLDRQMARKRPDSRNREKAKLRRARLYYKVWCQRQDFVHHVSSELARTKPVIVLEDLNVKGLMRNRRLAASIADAGFGELRRQLAYKCDWYGSTLIVADRFFPSTQLCSGCGNLGGSVKGLKGLRERTFDCEVCGLAIDRDENAAINLRQQGLRALAGELGIVPLPEGLREVTPDGEEGSGRRTTTAKPTSMKQEATARRSSGETRRSAPKGALVTAPRRADQ